MRSKKTEQGNTKMGFTLVEILVSVAIFAIVATMAIAAVLSLISAGEKSQTQNSVMSNLNVALEDMARNVRTGYDYSCPTVGISPDASLKPGQNCRLDGSNQIFQFVPANGGPNDRTVYGVQGNRLVEWEAGTNGLQYLTADEVHIEDARFYVFGASSATSQPHVLITIRGYVQTRSTTKSEFYLQTMMTQRLHESDVSNGEF